MQRIFASFLTLIALALSLQAADKDSPAAAATRKKLQVKVTVDFKDESLSEVIKELKKQIEDAKAGALSMVNDAGVSNNTKYTFAAKDRTVAVVLDGLLKKNSLGYIVVSKPGDRYDGWIRLKPGNERGHEGAAAESKAPPKEKDREPPPDDKEKAEKAAQTKFDFAKDLLREGKKDKAKTRFEEIIRVHPDTKAAGEAKKELDKLSG